MFSELQKTFTNNTPATALRIYFPNVLIILFVELTMKYPFHTSTLQHRQINYVQQLTFYFLGTLVYHKNRIFSIPSSQPTYMNIAQPSSYSTSFPPKTRMYNSFIILSPNKISHFSKLIYRTSYCIVQVFKFSLCTIYCIRYIYMYTEPYPLLLPIIPKIILLIILVD